MSCPKTVPNLLGKYVELGGLKKTSMNGKTGLVSGWDEKLQLFLVSIDGSVKAIKPMNLNYIPRKFVLHYNNGIAVILFGNLLELVCIKKITDFDHGMTLFRQIESQLGVDRPYAILHLKLEWFEFLRTDVFPKDPRCLLKCSTALEILLENCEFPDLIVKAKLLLAHCLVARNEQISLALDMLMSCTEEHYGLLPEIFCNIVIILTTARFSRPTIRKVCRLDRSLQERKNFRC